MAVKISLLVLALMFSNEYPQAAEKQKEDQKAVSTNPAAHQQTSKEHPSVVINVTGNTQSVDHACDSRDCNKEKEQWWEKLWSDPIATFTFALFLATAALIGAGIVQWRETRNVAKKELRAYLGATGLDIVFIDNNFIQARVEVANTGATPAKNVRQWMSLEIRDPSNSHNFQQPEAVHGKRSIVPGAKWTVHFDRQLSPEELLQLQKKEKVIFVWGKAEYFDCFTERQWLHYRFQNLGVITVRQPDGTSAHGGWALYVEENGNDAT